MKRLANNSYIFIVFLFLYLPIAILVLYSFNDATYSMLWHGLTTKWYSALKEDTDLLSACIHSVELATASASIATALGTIASISFYHYRFLGQKLLFAFLFILIIVPDIVYACALLIFFHLSALPLGFFSLLIAHISFNIPFVMFTLQTRLSNINPFLFEAASDLGAKNNIIIKQVILPLLWPAIIGSWLLSFTLSFDDVLISYFVAGPNFEILPLKIYSLIRSGITPEINALCSVIFLLSLIIVVMAQKVLRKKP